MYKNNQLSEMNCSSLTNLPDPDTVTEATIHMIHASSIIGSILNIRHIFNLLFFYRFRVQALLIHQMSFPSQSSFLHFGNIFHWNNSKPKLYHRLCSTKNELVPDQTAVEGCLLCILCVGCLIDSEQNGSSSWEWKQHLLCANNEGKHITC